MKASDVPELLAYLGANVVAIDIADDKLALAKALGASVTIDSRSVADVSEAVRDVTGGGAHVSVDALGHLGRVLRDHGLEPAAAAAGPKDGVIPQIGLRPRSTLGTQLTVAPKPVV